MIALSFICLINDHFYSSLLCYVDISSLLLGVKLSTNLSCFYKVILILDVCFAVLTYTSFVFMEKVLCMMIPLRVSESVKRLYLIRVTVYMQTF